MYLILEMYFNFNFNHTFSLSLSLSLKTGHGIPRDMEHHKKETW